MMGRIKDKKRRDQVTIDIQPIPLPPIPGREGVYPFDELEVGQSFFVPFIKEAHEMSGSVTSYNKTRAPKKFASRTVDGGVRVWRTA